MLSVSNVQMAQGSPIIRGAELLFYFGFGATRGPGPEPPTRSVSSNYIEGTGLATLRRDGFASMGPAVGASGGVLLTRPISLPRNRLHLFVNAILPTTLSSLRVDISPDERHALHARRCEPAALRLAGPLDSTRARMVLLDAGSSGSLECLAEQPVRLRFNLTGGSSRLFAFWMADATGKSAGYLAGGEIGMRTIRDV